MTLAGSAALAGWGFVAILLLFWRSFIPEYLKEKGKNLATHEDIDKLVTQVQAVTKATKEIESKISSDLWDRQKQWELRRDILFDAAKRVSQVEGKLLSLHTYWCSKLKGEIPDEGSRIRLEHQYVNEWREAMRSFEETEILVQVTCSRETVYAFAELSNLLRKTAAEITSNKIDAYPDTKAERDKKLVMARVTIRKELGITFGPATQPGVSLEPM
jgi:hypothetical protein